MLFFDFSEICSGDYDCFKLQIQMQITYLMVPCMLAGWKMKTIVVVFFYRKVHNFQMVITVSKTSHIIYKLVSTLETFSANTLYDSDC